MDKLNKALEYQAITHRYNFEDEEKYRESFKTIEQDIKDSIAYTEAISSKRREDK
jgi:hypothetical protein